MKAKWQRLLAPLQTPYGLALAAKNLGYDKRLLKPRTLAWPVISVGNLSVGGTGKTPIVIELARLLTQRGMHVDVLSRGYGRRSPRAVERVVPDGDAHRYGDEPLLIARATGVPVYVGASRYKAGLLAEREASAAEGVHLLDDGFQHRKLGRTIDIVLLRPTDHAGQLLPAGMLREPLQSLHRGDLFIMREHDAVSGAVLHWAGIHKPVWRMRRVMMPPTFEGRAVAFCGIAHPGDFFHQLSTSGVALIDRIAFPDHHRFRPRDIDMIARRAHGAGALLTTEKDFVRLSSEARRQLEAVAPLHPVPLRAKLLDEAGCTAELLRLLAARRTRPRAVRE